MKLKGYFFLRPEGREDICTCPMPDKSKQNGTYEEIHNLMIDFSESAKEIVERVIEYYQLIYSNQRKVVFESRIKDEDNEVENNE